MAEALLLYVLGTVAVLALALLPGTLNERLARIAGAVLLLLGFFLPTIDRGVKTVVSGYVLLAGGVGASLFGCRSLWRWQAERWHRRWEQLSRRVRIDSCVLDGQSVNFAEFAIDTPRTAARLRIVRGAWRQGPRGGLRALQELEGAGYEVLSNGDEFTRSLLSGPVRRLIARVDRLGGEAFELVLRPGLLQIRATFSVATDRRRVAFAEAAIALGAVVHERLLADLVQIGAVEPAPGLCEICGQGLCEPVATCARCGTPHHRECWEYNGRCSVYACGGRAWR